VSDGRITETVGRLDPAWIEPGSGRRVWVDLQCPTDEEARILIDVFRFHELAVEDALKEIQTPKIEDYDGYLYLILHGIDFSVAQHRFATHEIDIFLSDRYLVTIHDEFSRSVSKLLDVCPRNTFILGEGTAALLHRIVDAMVDNYGPEVDKLEARLQEVEATVFENPSVDDVRQILEIKRDVGSLRRVVTPQRDVVARLARREFPIIDEQVAYRFRDVYDHLVRLVEEANIFHDRGTGLLDAHLSFTSNRLNRVMKTLTVISTIFLPLTVLTGMFGMNVDLPHFPGPSWTQFWWIAGLMAAIAGSMLWIFSRSDWR
jgi:magnesium transporter